MAERTGRKKGKQMKVKHEKTRFAGFSEACTGKTVQVGIELDLVDKDRQANEVNPVIGFASHQ